MTTNKVLLTVSCISFLALAGCSTKTGNDDHALLVETNAMARAAKDASAQAAQDARAAREDANKAAQSAAAAAEKADRIFRQGQQK